MKKIAFLTVIFALILLTFCSFVYAKGISLAKKNKPPKIAPLLYRGIKFVAPNTVKEMGYVQAWDVETGKKVWEKKAYNVIKIPFFFEEDVFIISLSVEDGKLAVGNEKGNEYKIDIPKAILKN